MLTDKCFSRKVIAGVAVAVIALCILAFSLWKVAPECIFISWEAIAGVASAVIALCALFLTLWQTVVSRCHNKLSVTPHLMTWTHSDEGTNHYQIDLLNNGIGPALIKSFLIQVDNQTINGEGTEPIEKALKILFPHYSYHSHQAYVSDGYMMSEKERRPLVIIQFFGDTLPKSEEVKHAIKRTRLIIDYESIYGDQDRLDTKDFKSSFPAQSTPPLV